MLWGTLEMAVFLVKMMVPLGDQLVRGGVCFWMD